MDKSAEQEELAACHDGSEGSAELTAEEQRGRVSGSAEWRRSRGETGGIVDQSWRGFAAQAKAAGGRLPTYEEVVAFLGGKAFAPMVNSCCWVPSTVVGEDGAVRKDWTYVEERRGGGGMRVGEDKERRREMREQFRTEQRS